MRIILEGATAEITEKKSRFIATVLSVRSQEEADDFILRTKKKYWDARHNCSAMILGERGEMSRCSDDGEPSGTAVFRFGKHGHFQQYLAVKQWQFTDIILNSQYTRN